MINLNESYLIGALMKQGVGQNIIKNLLREFKGCRFYIRAKQSEHIDIIEDYQHFINAGYKKSTAIKRLSIGYEKSESQIRQIIKKVNLLHKNMSDTVSLI